jgi:hypothetical protein
MRVHIPSGYRLSLATLPEHQGPTVHCVHGPPPMFLAKDAALQPSAFARLETQHRGQFALARILDVQCVSPGKTNESMQ